MFDVVNDPFNDFDAQAYYRHPYTHPDFLFAYPTWSGRMLPTMGLEGLREGIKDAKYIATLKMLMRRNPNSPAASAARDYLGTLKDKINPDFWNAYVRKTTEGGYYHNVVRDISQNRNVVEWEAFTRIRRTVFDHITRLLSPRTSQLGDDKKTGF